LNGSGPADWSTHLFADSLHATPFGNQLMAQSIRSAINAKGWTF
jgi:phospholipase/lecithinase/hemolysin